MRCDRPAQSILPLASNSVAALPRLAQHRARDRSCMADSCQNWASVRFDFVLGPLVSRVSSQQQHGIHAVGSMCWLVCIELRLPHASVCWLGCLKLRLPHALTHRSFAPPFQLNRCGHRGRPLDWAARQRSPRPTQSSGALAGPSRPG